MVRTYGIEGIWLFAIKLMSFSSLIFAQYKVYNISFFKNGFKIVWFQNKKNVHGCYQPINTDILSMSKQYQ